MGRHSQPDAARELPEPWDLEPPGQRAAVGRAGWTDELDRAGRSGATAAPDTPAWPSRAAAFPSAAFPSAAFPLGAAPAAPVAPGVPVPGGRSSADSDNGHRALRPVPPLDASDPYGRPSPYAGSRLAAPARPAGPVGSGTRMAVAAGPVDAAPVGDLSTRPPSRSRRRGDVDDPDRSGPGGRRAGNLRVAGDPDQPAASHAGRGPRDPGSPGGASADADEPSLAVQWGVFLLQTLAGAGCGLGVWLGFYRLWERWPLYAVPAVGVAQIGMLLVARMLRRRYGHDLDLLTAVLTVAIGVVLTVLPVAFVLQSL